MSDSVNSILKLKVVPVIDSLKLRPDSPGKEKLLRKALKLFKKSSAPIELDDVNLNSIRDFNLEDPIHKDAMLLPFRRKLELVTGKDQWKMTLEFN